MYDKVLEDAAMLSRRYLNTIFTRKQYGEVVIEDEDMLAAFGEFMEFGVCFRAVKEILVINNKEQLLLEDIFSHLREVRGGIGKSVHPVEFIPSEVQKKIVVIEKLIKYG